jgi:D-sedoheptulose 7-phosphate isomerase
VKRHARQNGPLEREARALLRDAIASARRLERVRDALAAAAEVTIACLEGGGTVYFCGNGGSAADAQHLACELAGRFLAERPALAAVALTTNSSSLTAIGNDYGFDRVFSRQLEGLGLPGDVLIALTTSGGSANVLRAVEAAHGLGMTVIGMTGAKGVRFAARCDVALVTPSASTPRIQEGHITLGHALCELIERALFGRGRSPAGAGRKRSAGTPPGRRRAPARAKRGRR